MQEPIYNPERLRSDYAYRFDLADQFLTYVGTLEPYAEQVHYFIRMTVAMGLEVDNLFCTASRPVCPVKSRYEFITDRMEDEHGNAVPVINWALSCRGEEQRAIWHKVWFLERRHTLFGSYGYRRYSTYDERVALFNPALIQSELTAIEAEVNNFMVESKAERNDLLKGAPGMVEAELLGRRGINWSAFRSADQLAPFAILWDMVKYKHYLEALPKAVTNVGRLTSTTGQAPDENTPPLTLASRFEYQSQYLVVKDILAARDYCDAVSGLGTYRLNATVTTSLLKTLHTLGYYKDNHMPTTNEIIQISQTTFGKTVSHQTARKTKEDLVTWKFIPYARTLGST